jgi:hypothetical protein
MTRRSHPLVLVIALAGVGLSAVGAKADPPPTSINLDPEQSVVVPLHTWLTADVELTFPPGIKGPAVLYAAGEVPTDQHGGCRSSLAPESNQPATLTLRRNQGGAMSEPCKTLLNKFWREGGDYYISTGGRYFQISVEEPTAVASYSSPAEPPSHPSWVTPGNDQVYYFGLDGTLQNEKAGAMQPELLALAMQAKSKPLRLYYVKGQRVVALDFTWQKPNTPQAQTVLPAETFGEHCNWLRKKAATSPAKRYLMCVNLVNDGAADTRVYSINFDDADAENGHLWTNKGIDVYVYLKNGRSVEIGLTGSPGHTSAVYVQGTTAAGAETNVAVAAGGEPPAPSLPTGIHVEYQPFAPRVAGTNPLLEITVKQPEGDGTIDVAKFKREYYIEREYGIAIRAGLAALYGPWDKKYETRAGPANNTGNEITVAQDGVPSADFTVGVSFFFGRVGEFSYKPHFSIYTGFAFLSAEAKGAQAMTALMLGPELSIGKDFSLALVGGLRRTEELKDSSLVHSNATSDDLSKATVFGVTPVFGLMANLSPYVWTVGR